MKVFIRPRRVSQDKCPDSVTQGPAIARQALAVSSSGQVQAVITGSLRALRILGPSRPPLRVGMSILRAQRHHADTFSSHVRPYICREGHPALWTELGRRFGFRVCLGAPGECTQPLIRSAKTLG